MTPTSGWRTIRSGRPRSPRHGSASKLGIQHVKRCFFFPMSIVFSMFFLCLPDKTVPIFHLKQGKHRRLSLKLLRVSPRALPTDSDSQCTWTRMSGAGSFSCSESTKTALDHWSCLEFKLCIALFAWLSHVITSHDDLSICTYRSLRCVVPIHFDCSCVCRL